MFSFKLKNLKFLNQLIFFKSKFYFVRMRRKNLKMFKFFDDRRIGAIPRIFLTSIFVVFSFYHIPSIINFANKQLLEDKEFQNNSKAILAYTLNKKEGVESDGGELNEKDLLIDIFSLNDLETDTVRLNASTIKQLFQDTDYKLDDVRETKLVKPVALTLLPGEIKMIESTKKRKEFFIQIVLPLVLKENNNIRLDRKTLFKIINKSNNTKLEKKWLEKKYKQYGVTSKDLTTLKIRMDEIPVSLALAQAAKETGWGTSRFAQEGNALFGQWTWSGEGIKPAGADGDSKHKVAKFKVLKASVKAYQRNLNTHSGYKEFRRERAIQRDNEGKLNSLLLVNYLDKYAETGIEYTKILKKIIEQNSLTEFDDVKILPTTKKLKNLI